MKTKQQIKAKVIRLSDNVDSLKDKREKEPNHYVKFAIRKEILELDNRIGILNWVLNG